MSRNSKLTAEQRIRLRADLFEIQGGACVYCGGEMLPPEPLSRKTAVLDNACTLDHVQPLDAGGTDDFSNLVACCSICNIKKANANPERFMPEVEADKEDHRRFVRDLSRKRREARFGNRPFEGLATLLAQGAGG